MTRYGPRASDAPQSLINLTRRLQYRGTPFKIAMFDQWLVVLSGSEIVEEVRKLPDDAANPGEGILFVSPLSFSY